MFWVRGKQEFGKIKFCISPLLIPFLSYCCSSLDFLHSSFIQFFESVVFRFLSKFENFSTIISSNNVLYLISFMDSVQFSQSVVYDSATPWTTACQASLSITNSWSSPTPPPALNLSQHKGLFKWVSSLHKVAKVLEFQLQHQSYRWTPKTDLL